MLTYIKRQFEDKRGYAIIEEVKDDISVDQYAYYFGGIIRKECMNSECFGGMKEMEVHNVLLMEVAPLTITFEHPTKGRQIYQVAPDIKKWSKKKMSEYIEQVIALLNTEYQIYTKPSSHYKGNNFYMDKKTYK